MAKDSINGKMGEVIVVSTSMTRNMVMEPILGQMAANMWESGSIAKETVRAKLFLLMVHRDRGFGNRIKD